MEVLSRESQLSITEIREQFPILTSQVYGKPLVYLDNGASSQKPQSVIAALEKYYSSQHSNIHRGVHYLSQHATELYEQTRTATQQFFNAQHAHEIIFTKGTTDSINLVASSFGKRFIRENDEIIISTMEHHSNIVPWQMVCEEKKAKLKVIPITDSGEVDFEAFKQLISDKTKMISICHVSNTLGTVNPIKQIIQEAKKNGIPVLLDGAQAVPHTAVDVQELDADFYAFSSHKMYGPTGFGVLYGKEKWLDQMPPYQGGGDMIKTVTFEKTTYNDLPHKFEAGTPNIADGIAFNEAISFIQSVGYDFIHKHENELLNYGTQQLKSIEGLRVIGEAKEKAGVISFLVGDIHPYDMGTILDQLGIAVRTGHHCTEPLMNRFNIPGTVRASFAVYNTREEIDKLVEGVLKAKKMLQ